MKVLHVIDALGLGGGAEHSLVAMLPEFTRRGIENHVVCLYPRESGLFEQLPALGVPYDVVPGSNLLSKISRLRRIIKAEKPDVVHATLVNSCIAARLACVGLRTPQLNSLVNTTYDPVRAAALGVSPRKLAVLRAIDMVTARGVDRFHSLTEAVKQDAVCHLSIPPSRIEVIPRGRSLEDLGERTTQRRVAVRSAMGVSDGEFVFLNIGRQDHQKAQDVLIHGFERVAEDHPDARLWIAGRPGDATSQVMAAVQASRHPERITLLGHRTDVADLLCAADIFVLNSQYEGFGGVLIEAMALECPIIGSDASAIREVLSDGRYGLMTDRGSVASLATAMTALMADTQRQHELLTRAKERFLAEFELGEVSDRMVDLYKLVDHEV